MAHFQAETKATILQRMVNKIIARSSLTDLLSTSQLMQVCAAVARAIEKCQHGMEDILEDRDIDKVTGEDLDEWAKVILPAVITRRQGVRATGNVVFGRTAIVGALNIPVGTQVKVLESVGGSELIYTTTALGTIPGGSTTSGNVAVVAAKTGAEYNANPDTITGFVSKPSGVETVTNPAALTNGQSLETDDSFRNRIKAHILGLARCHVYGLESAALGTYDSVSGKTCLFAKAVEDPSLPGYTVLYIDDGAGTAEHTTSVLAQTPTSPAGGVAAGGETDIYLTHKPIKEESAFELRINGLAIATDRYYMDWAVGHIKLNSTYYPNGLTAADTIALDYTYYDQLVGEVQKVIDGDVADRANYPGYRAGGINAKVKVPQNSPQSVIANVTVKEGYGQTDVVADVVDAISNYINGLTVGEDVIHNQLIKRIMSVPGVYDVNVTAPTQSVTIGDYQLARISSSAIQVS